ncbi:MAG: PHB depolymerase family esterase [Ramlibacter sp.]
MARRTPTAAWAKAFERSFTALARTNLRAGARAAGFAVQARAASRKPPPGEGDWIAGMAIGAAGARRYRLYRPPDARFGERLPVVVMLHGCGQDAKGFATSTRMNRIAARERFLVLYPEQDRLANAQGCWNWFDTRSGLAFREADLILKAIDQVCLLYMGDASRVAVAGLSSGASMAALLVTRHPQRFKAVMMHSGIPPGTADSGLTALKAMNGRMTAGPLDATPESLAASWPALLVVHGAVDRVVAAGNAQAAVQMWAEAAGARAGAGRSVHRGQRYPMAVTDYKRGRDVVATLVEVGRLGHAWSGGAASQAYSDAKGPDASRMLWAFAAKQFRG